MNLMRFILAATFLLAISSQAITPDGKHKLVFIAGKPSHPPGMHEFKAGSMLLEKCLATVPNLIVDRHEMGWVSDEKTFADNNIKFMSGLYDRVEKNMETDPNHREFYKDVKRGIVSTINLSRILKGDL